MVGAAAFPGAMMGTPLVTGFLPVGILHHIRIEYREVVLALLGAISGASFFHWVNGDSVKARAISVDPTSISLFAAALAVSNMPVAAAIMMVEIFEGTAAPYDCIGSALSFHIVRSGVAYFGLTGDD